VTFAWFQSDGTLPVSNDLVNNNVGMSVHISIIAPLRSEGTLHSNPSEKANILNKQFQSAFTSEANTNIPDKGPITHPTMEPITISRDGVYKLIKNINPSKPTGPDTIAGMHVMDIGL
jgi:hypothetical protein